MSPSKNYYIKRGDKIRGPITEQQLRQLKNDGKLKSTDLISNRSDGGWKPVSGKRHAPTERSDEQTTTTSGQSLPPRRGNPQKVVRRSQPQTASGNNRQTLLAGSVAGIVLLVAGLSWMFWPSAESSGPVAEGSEIQLIPAPAAADPVGSMAESAESSGNPEGDGGLLRSNAESPEAFAAFSSFDDVLGREPDVKAFYDGISDPKAKAGVKAAIEHQIKYLKPERDGCVVGRVIAPQGTSLSSVRLNNRA